MVDELWSPFPLAESQFYFLDAEGAESEIESTPKFEIDNRLDVDHPNYNRDFSMDVLNFKIKFSLGTHVKLE